MVVYFTGTGNSSYIAHMIADKTGDNVIDAAEYIKGARTAELRSDKPWVFAAPTYAWRLPRVFKSFIMHGNFSGSKTAYFVMTCGGDIGNAGSEIQKLCADKDFAYMGVSPVIMPENYIAMFDVPDKEASAEIIKTAEVKLNAIIPFIIKREPFPPVNCGFSDWIKTAVINPVFYKFVVKAGQFHATQACISCGKCEKYCPLDNIALVNGTPQWGKNCTHCMACICGCPAEAIEYGSRSSGKPRYQCPEYLKEKR